MKTDGTDGTDFEQSGSGLEAPSLDGVREHLHVRLGLWTHRVIHAVFPIGSIHMTVIRPALVRCVWAAIPPLTPTLERA